MKKSMISTIILLTIIILMASFDLSLDGSPPIRLDPNISGKALFVCPAASNFWDPMAASFRLFDRYILMGFFFAAILLTFFWGWALYQNLLKDSFNKDAFAKPWGFTRLLFWAGIIMLFILNTPNRYRTVEVTGHPGDYVLCENTSLGAKVVPSSSVHDK
ncbi:MAG: hypothetical protein J6S80_00135 [Alphaproteobacteria bacterium]|nr:hypothetical protein [Alphaproteobacteria bacterium]